MAPKTKVVAETWYRPANFLAAIMNRIMVKRMIDKAQEQILTNLKTLTEK